MLDSLSHEQKTAFDALNLGPIWLNRVSSAPTPTAVIEEIPLGIVFLTKEDLPTDRQNILLGQIFRAAGLAFGQAQALHIDLINPSARFDILMTFGAASRIDELAQKQALMFTSRIDLPSLELIASEARQKSIAWKAVKAFLLSQR
jgi:hypothetical protein